MRPNELKHATSSRTDEEILLRLFRCMAFDEQCELLRDAFSTVASRCSLDPHFRLQRTEDLRRELDEGDLNERLWAAWPVDWPGEGIVELDYVGDPGSWLQSLLGENVFDFLFGGEKTDAGLAGNLADSYLRKIREAGFPLPSDLGGEPDFSGWTADEETQVTQEFVAFFFHWRERILTTLEGQNPLKKDDS